MRIATKRVYDALETADGYRVLVDRVWPRGLTKEHAAVALWAKNVAPSNALRQWFGHAPEKWNEFQRRYRVELAANAQAFDELRAAIKGKDTVTLVYGAKDEQHNQALVLQAILLGT
ncbi:MAG: DUF488 domain-containing protein [Betaproteobacteria bacterium]|nr:DUF488 domain-containing protein [Betaproteobacteria bacterium]